MDRENRRLIEDYRRNEAGPLENNLIDELMNGELDRQEFLTRATMFGLSLGTIGLLLGNGESRLRRAAGRPGRRHAPGRAHGRWLARAVPAQRRWRARAGRHPR